MTRTTRARQTAPFPALPRLFTILCVAVLASGQFSTPAAGQSYREIVVADAGEVTGRVFFESDFPPPETRQPDRDADTCGLRIPVETFTVDGDSKGLANVVIEIAGISAGKAFADAETAIQQLRCRYQPHVAVVRPGEEFDIVNSDPILHNVHAYLGDDTAFNLAQPFQGQANPQTLAEPGVVRVACDVHSWMEAWILVIDHPYFAVSDAQGRFSIGGVPPGEYTVTMWHELLGTAEKTVSVPAGGAGSVDFVIGG